LNVAFFILKTEIIITKRDTESLVWLMKSGVVR